VHEHEDALAVELTVLVHFVMEILPGARQGVVVEARRREQLWSFGERSHAEPDPALAVVPDEVEFL
jgi:hypothetical protein